MSDLCFLHVVEIDVFMEGDSKETKVEVTAPTERAAQEGVKTVLAMFPDAREIVVKGVSKCAS